MEKALEKLLSMKLQADEFEAIKGLQKTAKPKSKPKSDSIQFQPLKEEILKSKYILKLENNWDEDGALPVSPTIYETAIHFLQNYTMFIFETYKMIVETPSINPVKNGSIDLEWHTPNAQLLINIRDTQNAYYYGDQNNNINAIKGNVSTQTVEIFFAVWMTKLTL